MAAHVSNRENRALAELPFDIHVPLVRAGVLVFGIVQIPAGEGAPCIGRNARIGKLAFDIG